MPRLLLPFLLGAIALAACQALPPPSLVQAVGVPAVAAQASPVASPPGAPPAPSRPPAELPTDPTRPRIDLGKVLVSAPDDAGAMRTAGNPGAVLRATTVRLLAQHVLSKSLYALLHYGLVGPHQDTRVDLAKADVAVAADGSFAVTTLGDRSRFVQHGDELTLLPLDNGAEVGDFATALVP